MCNSILTLPPHLKLHLPYTCFPCSLWYQIRILYVLKTMQLYSKAYSINCILVTCFFCERPTWSTNETHHMKYYTCGNFCPYLYVIWQHCPLVVLFLVPYNMSCPKGQGLPIYQLWSFVTCTESTWIHFIHSQTPFPSSFKWNERSVVKIMTLKSMATHVNTGTHAQAANIH